MGMSLPLRERIIKALLLILLLEGNCMFVRRIFGANTSIIAGSVRFFYYFMRKITKIIWRIQNNVIPLHRKREIGGTKQRNGM
jgi:hypothetical protein